MEDPNLLRERLEECLRRAAEVRAKIEERVGNLAALTSAPKTEPQSPEPPSDEAAKEGNPAEPPAAEGQLKKE